MKFEVTKTGIKLSELKNIRKYPYKKYNRYTDERERKYLVDEQKVPSVTTILGKTKDDKFLKAWRDRVGHEEANRIVKQASAVGTEMHYVLEKTLDGTGYYNLQPQAQKPRMMAQKILENLHPLQEIWGNEVSLAYKQEYAGTTDCIALHNDKPTIIDFKQANRAKKEEWVEDYKLQLGAYYLAHKDTYGPIEQGLITICTRDLQYQEFKLTEPDLQEFSEKFLERLEQYKKLDI
tara:strand:+ start:181 stop:885 length:705 start_codon:yes stop_codon:yes gene_type:complete